MQWCLGMFASASTWVVNTIRSVGEATTPGASYRVFFLETADQLPPGWAGSERLLIKTHHTDDIAADLLARAASRIWISIRDPRDCVASLMTYMHLDFDNSLASVERSALACARPAGSPKATLLRYEDKFADNLATLDLFAAGFGAVLTPDDRQTLFQATRREAIEAMIESFGADETLDDGTPGHRVHPATQWHTHHLNRTGEIERWRRTLTAAQVAEVEFRLGAWMRRFGYAG